MPDDFYIDWPTFWSRERHDHEWLIDSVLARGRGHALYAYHKTGKSLITLWLAALLATTKDPVVVLYLDYEMTEEDVYERMIDMGYGGHVDLERLRYALLPTLAPLDTEQGARELFWRIDSVASFHPGHHIVVIIDTMTRAAQGDENASDTYRNFYRHTGLKLKQRGITWVRNDHAGKDGGRGQRGSSSKGDDVDIIWKVERAEDGFLLIRDAARMSWVPEKVALRITEEPFGLEVVPTLLPPGTGQVVELLDAMGIDPPTSVRVTRDLLRDAGHQTRMATVSAAVKIRRTRLRDTPVSGGKHSGNVHMFGSRKQGGKHAETPGA